jgi:GH25 family lysozyme M1 (1,4-beta-N-acetylmuramidase)
MCFDRHFAWLKYFAYHLVPVLASNYKQNVLSQAKVRKVCYSLAEHYVKSVYLNVFLGGEVCNINETL